MALDTKNTCLKCMQAWLWVWIALTLVLAWKALTDGDASKGMDALICLAVAASSFAVCKFLYKFLHKEKFSLQPPELNK